MLHRPQGLRVAATLAGLALLALTTAAAPAAPSAFVTPALTVVTRSATPYRWPVLIIVAHQPVLVALDTLRPIPDPGTGQSAFVPDGPAPTGWAWAVGHNGPLAPGTYHWVLTARRLPPTATVVGVVLTLPPHGTGNVRIADQVIAPWIVPGPPGAHPLAPHMAWHARWTGRHWVITLSATNPGPVAYAINSRFDLYHGPTWLGERVALTWPTLLPHTTATRLVTLPGTPFPERVRWQWYWSGGTTPGALWRTLPIASVSQSPTHPALLSPRIITLAWTTTTRWIRRHPRVAGGAGVAVAGGAAWMFSPWWLLAVRRKPRPRHRLPPPLF